MNRESALKILLALVGLLFIALGYPRVVFIRQDPALSMQFSLYVRLGIFLLLAILDPSDRQFGCRLVKRFTLSVNSLREPKRQEKRSSRAPRKTAPLNPLNCHSGQDNPKWAY
jgi:hypothetical protein